MTSTAASTIIYGPKKTRRFGAALLFDITAPQTNLVVERGSAIPRASVIVTSAARHIIDHSKAGDKVESIVVFGSRENPTQHPDIKEITENLRALRGKWYARAKLCIVSDTPKVCSSAASALHMYDNLLQTYEWGSTKVFTSATGVKGTELAPLTKQLGVFENLVVRARFYRGDLDNSEEKEVRAWIKRLVEMSPREIEFIKGSLPESKKVLKAVTKTREQQIIDEVAEATGLTVKMVDHEPLIS
ncbi:MAG: hypothetical protein ACI8QZ_002568 [Chlamydiales bacterium]|jgi:hypothetical protein